MPSTGLDQVPSFTGSEGDPNHLSESPDASHQDDSEDNPIQESTPARTDLGQAGLENTPGVASAVSAAGSAPPASTEFMLHRTLHKKAQEQKLALEVNWVVGQRLETLTGDLVNLHNVNQALEERVQQLEESLKTVSEEAERAMLKMPEGTGVLSPEWSEWDVVEDPS